MTRSFPVFVVILAGTMMALWGCAASVPPADTVLDGTVVEDEFTLPADEDAVMAALSFVNNQLLVQALPGADAQAIQDAIQDAGARVIDEIAEIGVLVLETADGKLIETGPRLADTGLFETLQKNYFYEPGLTPNDSLFLQQKHLPQIRAEQAWDISTGDPSVVIAIVDTGIDPDHPDLKGKIIGGRNIYDANGRFDDVLGHGTLVAGVAAAASNNAVGVTGVAWKSPILAVRVGNTQGLATSQHVAAGILWAAGQGAKVINVSFAPLWSDKVVSSSAQQAFSRGALVVVSAGNKGGLTKAIGFEEMLFAGAITPENKIASFSDKGPFVDLVAPGTNIRSTSFDGGYSMASGTSFSAPIVCGVVALTWSANPGLRPITIQEAVLSTAKDLGAAGKDDTFGRGAVDAAAAVQKAANTFDPVDTTPPVVRVTRPVAGQSLSVRASADVTATDKYGVADVVMSVDGVPFATDTRLPYSFVFDMGSFSAGLHDLSFVATDLSGNASSAKTVRVNFTVVSAPGSGSAGTIRFTAPAAGALVSGDVTIKASLSDADGLATVEWLIDGKSVFVSALSGRSSGVSYVWRTGSFARGAHTITASVTDNLGNLTRGSLTLTRK